MAVKTPRDIDFLIEKCKRDILSIEHYIKSGVDSKDKVVNNSALQHERHRKHAQIYMLMKMRLESVQMQLRLGVIDHHEGRELIEFYRDDMRGRYVQGADAKYEYRRLRGEIPKRRRRRPKN
jgi:hypothetical protein